MRVRGEERMKQEFSTPPILISGGDGFIGKILVERLLIDDLPVLVIDNNITSYPNDVSHPHFEKRADDVSYIDIEDIPTVSGIVHLASVAAPLVYMEQPSLVINPNTLGTRKLIEIARRDNTRMLFASTSEVYGHLLPDAVGGGGITEAANAAITLLSRRSCYATAKRFGEELVLDFKNSGGNAGNFRLFNVYGPKMDEKNTGYGRVIPNFIHRMISKDPIYIYGDGTQIRSFLWIDDAVDAILKLLFFEGDLPDAVNIGNDEPITINELAKRIAKTLGTDYRTMYIPMEKDDPMWRRPCTDLMTDLTGWRPKVNLDHGLKNILGDRAYGSI